MTDSTSDTDEAPESGLGRERGMTAEHAAALAGMGYAGEDEAQATFDLECSCAECLKFR